MASSENNIREILVRLINRLAEGALRVLGLGEGQPEPSRISVTVVWQLEVWWERQLPLVISEARLGPAVAQKLRLALGELAEELERVSGEGGDAEAIRRAVLAFRDRWSGWAARVATTESTRIASGAVLSSEAARQPGALKEWVTSHDQKVRSSHRMIDGTRVAVGGLFSFPEGQLAYPGDPNGPLEEILGCRCGIRIVQKGGRA